MQSTKLLVACLFVAALLAGWQRADVATLDYQLTEMIQECETGSQREILETRARMGNGEKVEKYKLDGYVCSVGELIGTSSYAYAGRYVSLQGIQARIVEKYYDQLKAQERVWPYYLASVFIAAGLICLFWESIFSNTKRLVLGGFRGVSWLWYFLLERIREFFSAIRGH